MITPPKRRGLRDALASVFESFSGLGWNLEAFWRSDGPSQLQPPTVNALIYGSVAGAILRKGDRGMDLDVDYRFPGRIALGGDITFFHQVEPLNEMKGIFGRMRFPDRTRIRGDLEGVIESQARPWFWWITQLNPSKWQELSVELPELVGRELIRIGESHIVMMWNSPYDRFEELARLARLLGASRRWPRVVPLG